MAEVRSSRVWTRQPGPTAEINWSNPLTRGLVSALSPWMDHARRIPVSRVGAPEQTVRQYGLSVKGTNAGLVSVPVSNLGAELSVLSVGFWTSVAGSGSNLGLSSTAGNAIFGVSSEVTTSNNRWALRQTNSGSFVGRNYGTNQNTSGVNVVLCGVFTSGTDIDVYWNGRLDKGTVPGGSTSSSGSNTIFNRFSLGGVNASPVNYAKVGVDTALGLLYNRALSASEIAELSLDPWQIFAPQRQVSYFTAGGAYTISADAGSYALTGQAATLLRSYAVAGDFGSYALTGQAATLLRSYAVAGDFGSYALAGQDASLLRSFALDGAYGTYTVAGQQATLSRSYAVEAAAGSYATDGQAATILFSRLLEAASGSYSVTGQGATVEVSGQPTPSVDNPLIKLRSFTERRRF